MKARLGIENGRPIVKNLIGVTNTSLVLDLTEKEFKLALNGPVKESRELIKDKLMEIFNEPTPELLSSIYNTIDSKEF